MAGALKLKGLLQWCKKYSDGYPGVEVTNFTSSWKDGLAFCAIIHKFRPDLIDFNSLSKENVLENNALAFRLAEQELGIPALLDAEDMVAMRVPDKLCIVTYVSQYYNHLKDINPEGGPGVQKAVKRPGATSPTYSPETKRISKAPQTQKPEKSDGLPVPAKRNTLGDTCTECKKKVYLLERHMFEGKLYHRQCYRQSEKGRGSFTRSLSPSSPTKSVEMSLSPPSSETSPFRQRKNDQNISPQKYASRPKIPESLLDKKSDTSVESKNVRPLQQKQGVRLESPMETDEKDSQPAWMKWVDKKGTSSPEKKSSAGAMTNGAKNETTPSKISNTYAEIRKTEKPSSAPSGDRAWNKKTNVTEKGGANSKPAWAKSEPVGSKTEKHDLPKTGTSVTNSSSSSSSSPQSATPMSKVNRFDKGEVKSSVFKYGTPELSKTRPKEQKEEGILGANGKEKSSLTPSSGVSSTQSKQADESAKAGLLKSLAGFRGASPATSPVSHSGAEKSGPSGTANFGVTLKTTPVVNQRGKSPIRPDQTPSSSSGDVNKSSTVVSVTKSVGKVNNKRDLSPGKTNLEKKPDTRSSPSKWATRTTGSSNDNVSKLTTTSPETKPSVISYADRDISPNKAAKFENKTDSKASPSMLATRGDKLPTTSTTKPVSDGHKTPSPEMRRGRSPHLENKAGAASSTVKSDVGKSSQGADTKSVLPANKAIRDTKSQVIVETKIRSDPSPSRPVSVIPGAVPPPKPPRTLLRNAKLDDRPEWQIEAEKRKNARKGEYKDPEKPWLYKDTDSPIKTVESSKKYDRPESLNPFDSVDSPEKESPIKYKPANPFADSEDELENDEPSPGNKSPKYKPANPFDGASTDEEIENPFEGDTLPFKTSTMRTEDKKADTTNEATKLEKSPKKTPWWKYSKPEVADSPKKRAAPQVPGLPSSPNVQRKEENGDLKPSGTPALPAFERNTPRTASPRTKGKAPRPTGPPQVTPSPHGSPAKSHGHLQVAKNEPPKPEWVGSPMKNLKKIRPDKFEFNRMSSTEMESDSSSHVSLDSPVRDIRSRSKSPGVGARSPAIRRSIKNMPAPPHPVPAARRKIITEERISPDAIIRELDELDKKQTAIESKARILEEAIRDAELNESPQEDEFLMQWFEMVNDKNQLVRREADLVYINRQQELEEMHADIEHELRHLMSRQEQLKTPADRAREEELLQELLQIVNQRNNIVENMDDDRIRYEEEDRVIGEMLAMKFEGKAGSADEKSKKKKKKKEKKKKKKHEKHEFHCIAGQD